MSRIPLRDVKMEALIGRPHRLETWTTNSLDGRGRMYVAYRLTSPEGVLFEGADFSPGPCIVEDSDAALRMLMGFLTLGLDDTDSSYFDNYTPPQMAFSKSYDCEALSLYGLDLGDYELEEDNLPFEDWEDTNA